MRFLRDFRYYPLRAQWLSLCANSFLIVELNDVALRGIRASRNSQFQKTYFTIKEPYQAAIPVYFMARCMKKRGLVGTGDCSCSPLRPGWRREESERPSILRRFLGRKI
jgi:hypothetical protein